LSSDTAPKKAGIRTDVISVSHSKSPCKTDENPLTVLVKYYISLITMRRPQAVLENHSSPRSLKMLFGPCATALLFCLPLSYQAKALVFNYSNLVGTEVDFGGGGFNFTGTNGYQFQITTVNGGGAAQGLDGYIATSGPFTIGTISTSGAEQTASVSGTGILHITDGSSVDLTGTLVWDDITTFGVGGILDLTGTVNLTGITYTGLNPDLRALAAAGSASEVVTFQIMSGQNLTTLKSSGGEASYSGSITPVPEPGAFALMGVGLAGVFAFRRNRNK
jgi:hypothetical protein